MTPEQIGHINAHGTSTPSTTWPSRRPSRRCSGQPHRRSPRPRASPATGSGACGAIEAVAVLLSIEHAPHPTHLGIRTARPRHPSRRRGRRGPPVGSRARSCPIRSGSAATTAAWSSRRPERPGRPTGRRWTVVPRQPLALRAMVEHSPTESEPLAHGAVRSGRGADPPVPEADRSDLAIGAFTPHGPWTVDPAAMAWRFPSTDSGGVDALREDAARLAHASVRPQHLPSVGPGGHRRLPPGLGPAGLGLRDRGTPYVAVRAVPPAAPGLRATRAPPTSSWGRSSPRARGSSPRSWWRSSGCCVTGCRRSPSPSFVASSKRTSGGRSAEVFTSFDRVPVASASIAQVHAAHAAHRRARGGQGPATGTWPRWSGCDLAAMSWIAPLLVGRIPVAALANPPALVELFAETIVEELDFRLEAQNMLDIAAVFTAETGQRVHRRAPAPPGAGHPTGAGHGAPRTGSPGATPPGMRAAGIDTAAVLRSSLIAFLEGALLYGVFHGDLHGGNLMVQADGTVALLDFGITGRLDEREAPGVPPPADGGHRQRPDRPGRGAARPRCATGRLRRRRGHPRPGPRPTGRSTPPR